MVAIVYVVIIAVFAFVLGMLFVGWIGPQGRTVRIRHLVLHFHPPKEWGER